MNHFLTNLDAQFDGSAETLGPGSFQGPRRYLEHAQPIDLYWQYMAYAEAQGQEGAALSTFMRCFKKVFSEHLQLARIW